MNFYKNYIEPFFNSIIFLVIVIAVTLLDLMTLLAGRAGIFTVLGLALGIYIIYSHPVSATPVRDWLRKAKNLLASLFQ